MQRTPALPDGWIECRIKQVEAADVAEAPLLEPEFQVTVDVGRVYYWKESTSEVSFCPPPGSSPLSFEAFKHFGHIGLNFGEA